MTGTVKNTSASTIKWKTESWGDSPLALLALHFHPVSKGLTNYINENCFVQKVAKGKHIVRTGEMCNAIYFIRKGIMRGYIKDGRKDITTWISNENEMVTSIRGFHLQEPAIENIQAIEDCELVLAYYDNLQYLYNNFMEMNIVGRKLLERYYIDAEERAYIARLAKASSKYQYLMNTRGHLTNRIPLKYIASYLGMTIETLSRLRSKLLQSVD